MPYYEYRCPVHGRFEVQQSMGAARKADCPKCGIPADFRVSSFSFRFAQPLRIFQDQPYGQKPVEVGRIADSSSSDERNLDTPPDYPNLLEV